MQTQAAFPPQSAPLGGSRGARTPAWREPMIRGVLAIVLGIVLFAFPVSAAIVFAILFGVYALVDGVIALMHAFRSPHPDAGRWWAMIARGAVGVIVGLVAILFPTLAAAALGTLIAIWAIVAGGLELAAAFRVNHDVPREVALAVIGALTIALGAVLLFFPILALVAQIWVVAAYAIITGIALIAYATQLRRRGITVSSGAEL